jgi:hypothetical protein
VPRCSVRVTASYELRTEAADRVGTFKRGDSGCFHCKRVLRRGIAVRATSLYALPQPGMGRQFIARGKRLNRRSFC